VRYAFEATHPVRGCDLTEYQVVPVSGASDRTPLFQVEGSPDDIPSSWVHAGHVPGHVVITRPLPPPSPAGWGYGYFVSGSTRVAISPSVALAGDPCNP
jgi:hypothetical protein